MSSDFKKTVEEFAKTFNAEVDTVLAKTALDLFSGIILDTPVLTGRARASWNLTKGQVDPSVAPEGSDSYTPPNAILIGASLLPLGENKIIYISNNLSYIVDLEEGSSQKAPEGMVAKNVARFQSSLEKAVKNVGG